VNNPKLTDKAREEIARVYLEPLLRKAVPEAWQETAETFCKNRCGRIPDQSEKFCFMATTIFEQRYKDILKRQYQLN
jgi:hypothetical protein